MTDQAATERPARPPAAPAPHVSGTVAAGLVLFLVVLVFLAWQLRGGNDPKLGAPKTAQVAAAAQRRVVVVRRMIRTKIIVTPAPSAAPVASGTFAASSGGATSPAPVDAAPPVAAAPVAAAPAPAPVTTRAS